MSRFFLILSYCSDLILFYLLFSSKNQTNEQDGWKLFHRIDSCWLLTITILCAVILPVTLPYAAGLLFFEPPPPPNMEKRIRISPKKKLKGLIIRIITRGTYPQLLIENVSHNARMIEKNLECDFFKIHIVSERDLSRTLELTQNKNVEIFLVPQNYVTPKGTLYRARNMVYYLENSSPKKACDDKDAWILAIDEDVFISQSLMEEFKTRFLQQRSCLMTQSPTTPLTWTGVGCWRGLSVIVKFLEYFRVAYQMTSLWYQIGSSQGGVHASVHGGCYFVRADVEREIGYDFGPFCSMNDDIVFGHRFIAAGHKIFYLNGWYREGTPPDAYAYVLQRGRWYRGHVYALFKNKHTNPGPAFERPQKIGIGTLVFLYPIFASTLTAFLLLSIVRTSMLILWPEDCVFEGFTSGYVIIDMIRSFSLASLISTVFYGWHFTDEEKSCVWYSKMIGGPAVLLILIFRGGSFNVARWIWLYALATTLPFSPCMAIECATGLLALWKLAQELWRGSTNFVHTLKKEH